MRWSRSISVRSSPPFARCVEPVEQVVDLGAVGLGEPFGGESRADGLERGPYLGEAAEILDLDARDEHPATRVHVHEPLVREALERLANRRPTGLESLHQCPLADDRARLELERDDQLADREIGALALRPRVGGLRLVDDESRSTTSGDGAGRGRVAAPPRSAYLSQALTLPGFAFTHCLRRLVRIHVLAGDEVGDVVLVACRPLPALDHTDARATRSWRTSTVMTFSMIVCPYSQR